MQTEYVEIKKLTHLERNPRKITQDQFAKLCKNIEEDPEFFDLRPCLVSQVDGNLVVYAGNQRLRAAKKLGWKSVPCIIQVGLDDETMKERAAKDNAHFGEWDWDILSSDYNVADLLLMGFTEKDLQIAMPDIELDYPSNAKEEGCKCPTCGKKMKKEKNI